MNCGIQRIWNAATVLLTLMLITWLTSCQSNEQPAFTLSSGEHLIIMTWNVRGYPEHDQISADWFHGQLSRMSPDVVCIQEIANEEKVQRFLSTETRFSKAAFQDSNDSQDNAIFVTDAVEMKDIPDPQGFQHPAQAAYLSYKGFDAVVITVHLSWTDVERRRREKQLLCNTVPEMLKIDPDVIIAGDFNTAEADMKDMAKTVGMIVMAAAGQDGVGTTHAGNRYDYFLISRDLANEEAVTCHIEQFAGNDLNIAKKVSDHLPVIAWFKTDIRFKDRKEE